MGDSIVALYDRPLDVVDLTTNEPWGDAGAADGEADDPNLPADVSNDSGIAEWSPSQYILQKKILI